MDLPRGGWGLGYIHKDRSHKNYNQYFVFHVKNYINIAYFLICFGDNVFKILLKHVQ
jgi:hypothetical protein